MKSECHQRAGAHAATPCAAGSRTAAASIIARHPGARKELRELQRCRHRLGSAWVLAAATSTPFHPPSRSGQGQHQRKQYRGSPPLVRHDMHLSCQRIHARGRAEDLCPRIWSHPARGSRREHVVSRESLLTQPQ